MPRSLYATDTDLTAENLLVCLPSLAARCGSMTRRLSRRQIAQLSQFDVVRFAQKACSNIHILRLMREQGVKVDSVSLGRLNVRWRRGMTRSSAEEYRFTADLIDEGDAGTSTNLQIPVNAGSVDMLSQLGRSLSSHRVWLRVNRGFGHGHSQNQHRQRKQQTRDLVQPSAGGAGSDMRRYQLQLVGITCILAPGLINSRTGTGLRRDGASGGC